MVNKALMNRLNPFNKKKNELLAAAAKKVQAARKATLKAKRSKDAKKGKAVRTARWNALSAGLVDSFQKADDLLAEEAKAGNYVPGDTSDEEEDD